MNRKKAIDTHVHFWKIADYAPFKGWFGDKTFLDQDYLPTDLNPHLAACDVESAIIVGAAPDSHEQNLWYVDLAEQNETICAVVGSYTFENQQLAACLDAFADRSAFVGIRTRPAAPPNLWLDDVNAKVGMAELRARGLTLDVLVDHQLLPAVATFAARYDDVPFIVNHCGLPPFCDGDLTMWSKNMTALAAVPNVVVKYSSFFLHSYVLPEKSHTTSQIAEMGQNFFGRMSLNCDRNLLQKAADLLFESFGVERLLWGSNWPPELIGGTYCDAYDLMLGCAGQLSDSEYNSVFRENAERVY